MKKIGIKALILIGAGCLLCACTKPPKPDTTAKIPAFKATTTTTKAEISPIRLRIIQETAFSVGAQGGLAWRAQKLNEIMKSRHQELTQIFNFQALILNHNVLPPVIVQAIDTINQDNPDTLRIADKTYEIFKPARFVTAAPTWRLYLMMNFKKPEEPDTTLLPKTAAEREVWNVYVAKGWESGILQANEIYSANLGRLRRDFEGMVLYRELLAQNIVSAPFVAKANMGITGGGTDMRINDQILRITSHSELNANSREWQAQIAKGVKHQPIRDSRQQYLKSTIVK